MLIYYPSNGQPQVKLLRTDSVISVPEGMVLFLQEYYSQSFSLRRDVHSMQSTRRILSAVCLLALIAIGCLAASVSAQESRALLVCTPDRCISSWTRTSDGGLTAEIIGDFRVDYKEYTISGKEGHFSQPPQDKSQATTRLRAVVTLDPRLAQAGDDGFELTAGDRIEIDLDDEQISADGGIRINAKETLITAEQLVGGPLSHMRPLIERICQTMEERLVLLVQEWLDGADSSDRLMLIEGDVNAVDASFTFSGQQLVANMTSESYLFIGPHTMEMKVEEE
jgi:hypothetical protein